jgi:sugar phosphate isomerase/epimerase
MIGLSPELYLSAVLSFIKDTIGLLEVDMDIKYSISLWNYYHYSALPSLECIIASIREQGYGIELWSGWKEEVDLFDDIGRKRLKNLVQGMTISLHSSVVPTFDNHNKQINAAAELGAKVIVIHSKDLITEASSVIDIPFARDIVSYAKEHGVILALENTYELPFLIDAIDNIEGLGICLDIGHVYLTSDPMSIYLNELKERLIHLHIQDVLPTLEKGLPGTSPDHFTPGTGGIPREDWELLSTTLRDIDYKGIAVFEIMPRNPLQTALIARDFMQGLLSECMSYS